MAATPQTSPQTSGAVLLRRPLPPLPRKEEQISIRKRQTQNRKNDASSKHNSIQVLNSLQRQTTRQKTNELVKENDKMKEYQQRIALLFSDRKPRGGDPFPLRSPKKALDIDHNAFIDDSYEPPPPIFRLDDFLLKKEDKSEDEMDNERKIQTRLIEKPLIPWRVYESKNGRPARDEDFTCQRIILDEEVELPELQLRIPFRQRLIEEKAYLLENYSDEFAAKLATFYEAKASRKPAIARPTYFTKDKSQYIGEDNVVYEVDSEDDTSSLMTQNYTQDVGNFVMASTKQDSRRSRIISADEVGMEVDNLEGEAFLVNSPPLFFQGELCARSPSPFEFEDDRTVGPVELALFQCIKNGGTKLNLKAHFMDQLPNISQLSTLLVHVNLSFNFFVTIPEELFEVHNLETLKLRNNPICFIPDGIAQLTNLKNLILSFCCISSLPQSIFHLTNLETLDLSYNEIAFIADELRNLKSLKVLNLEGNRLTSFPRGILLLDLRILNVGNNFTHHLFWKSTAPPQPQHLVEICATKLAQRHQHLDVQTKDVRLKSLLASVSACDFCGGPKFGQGLRVIKPAAEIFGVKNLPVLFYVCSQNCRGILRRSTELSISPESTWQMQEVLEVHRT